MRSGARASWQRPHRPFAYGPLNPHRCALMITGPDRCSASCGSVCVLQTPRRPAGLARGRKKRAPTGSGQSRERQASGQRHYLAYGKSHLSPSSQAWPPRLSSGNVPVARVARDGDRRPPDIVMLYWSFGCPGSPARSSFDERRRPVSLVITAAERSSIGTEYPPRLNTFPQ